MSSFFGHLFRISTFGESHGGGVGVVIDGCPPLIEITEADIQRDLDRRRPGQPAAQPGPLREDRLGGRRARRDAGRREDHRRRH